MIPKIIGTIMLLLLFPAFVFAGNTVLSGAVMDTQGHALGGATVMLRKHDNNESGANPGDYQYKQVTQPSGVFLFQNVDTGAYDVFCEKEGYQSQLQIATVRPYLVDNVYCMLQSTSPAVVQPLPGNVFHVSDVNLDTARVFVAFATDASDNSQSQLKPDSSNLTGFPVDSPYSTLPEMGAILYGGNPMQQNPLMDLMLHGAARNPAMVIQATHPNSISLVDTKNNNVVATIPATSRPFWLAFSPDGKRLWIVDEMHNLTMYSYRGERLASVSLGENIVSDLAVSPDGSRVYLAMRSFPDPEILIADGVSNALVGRFALPAVHGEPGGVAVSRDGRTLAVSMGSAGMGWLEVLDARTGQIEKEIQVGSQPLGVGITPNGERAIVANYSAGTVDVVDVASGNVVADIRSGLQPSRVAMRSDGRVAFVTNKGDNSLSVIDVANGVQLAKIPVGKEPMGVAASPDGKRVYVANNDSGEITIIDGITLSILGSTTPIQGLHPWGVAVRP